MLYPLPSGIVALRVQVGCCILFDSEISEHYCHFDACSSYSHLPARKIEVCFVE